jgi:hypothetical protein
LFFHKVSFLSRRRGGISPVACDGFHPTAGVFHHKAISFFFLLRSFLKIAVCVFRTVWKMRGKDAMPGGIDDIHGKAVMIYRLRRMIFAPAA